MSARVQAKQTSVPVIDGGTSIDGNGGPPVRDALIIIRGEKFDVVSHPRREVRRGLPEGGDASSPAGESAYPRDATVIRTRGEYILPGLISGSTARSARSPGKEADIALLDAAAINIAPLNHVPGAVFKEVKRRFRRDESFHPLQEFAHESH